MPFLPFDQDEENKKQNQQSQNISGTSNVINSSNSAQNIPGQPQKSGSWTNLNDYLDANRDNADAMGSSIASNINQKGSQAQTQIQEFQSKAPTVNAYDPNQAYSKLGSLNDQEKADYRNQRQTGGYAGPKSIDQVEGFSDIQKNALDASSLAKNAGSEIGQQQLLKDTYNRPDYTNGQNKLDQVLLQNSAGSKAALEGVSSRFSGLDKLFQDTSSEVGSKVNQANQQALQNKQSVLSAEEKQWQDLMNPIQARANEQNRLNPELISRVTNDASDFTLNDETLALLGLAEGQKAYDLNLQSYLTPNNTQVGLNEVANQQERQRYKALADLIEDSSRTQINDQGKEIKPITFNKDQFEKDALAREPQYVAYEKNHSQSGKFGVQPGSFFPEMPTLTYNQILAKITDMNQLVGTKFNQELLGAGLREAYAAKALIEQNMGNDTRIKKG